LSFQGRGRGGHGFWGKTNSWGARTIFRPRHGPWLGSLIFVGVTGVEDRKTGPFFVKIRQEGYRAGFDPKKKKKKTKEKKKPWGGPKKKVRFASLPGRGWRVFGASLFTPLACGKRKKKKKGGIK